MSLLTLVLGGLVLLLILLLFFRRDPPLPKSRFWPPGPKGLPLVGCLFQLLRENPVEYFTRLSRQYGPVVGLRLGQHRVVVLTSQPWLHQAFVRQGEVFAGRPQGTVMTFIAGGRGVVMAEGQKWKDSRRLTMQVLREYGMGGRNIENYVSLEVHALMDALKTKVNKPYEIRHDLATSVLNIVWHMFAGEHFSMGDPTLRWMVSALDKTVSLIDQGGFLNFIPFIQFVGTFLRPRAFQILYSMVHRIMYFRELIHCHRQRVADPSRQHDLVYSFLLEQQKLQDKGLPLGTFTDFQLVWLLSDLFIAGLDTSVSVLRWAVLFVVTRPDVTARLHAELDAVVGSDRRPSLSDRDALPYMEAFLSEVLRFSSVLALVSHAAKEDTTFGPYRIPAGTMVIGNIWGIHHDPKVWGDPEVFRPERFLDHEGKLHKSDHLVPFSLGRRNCLGESLARTELFLLLSAMVQEYEFLPGGEMPSLQYVYGLFLHPKPYLIILKPRATADNPIVNDAELPDHENERVYVHQTRPEEEADFIDLESEIITERTVPVRKEVTEADFVDLQSEIITERTVPVRKEVTEADFVDLESEIITERTVPVRKEVTEACEIDANIEKKDKSM